MKKILLLAVMAISLSLGACSKDDEGRSTVSGTTWERYEDEILGEFKFISKTECYYQISFFLGSQKFEYTYKQQGDIISMTPKISSNGKLKGTIHGETMHVKNIDNGATIGIFIKQ